MVFAQSCDINGKKHYNYEDVKSILDKNKCNSCHSTTANPNLWSYNTYDSFISSSYCSQSIIVHGQPNQSLLIDKLNGGPTSCGNAMPLGSQKISNADLIALEAWIEVGAPEYCLSEFDQLKTILNKNNCTSCHTANDSWSFDTYSSLFVKPQSSVCEGQEIIKYDAKNSLLYQKISNTASCGLRMPIEGNPVSDFDVDKIRDWINAGAPESAKALPVSLADFRTEIEGEKILLQWQTASELNTSHFDIEFSRDGIHFEHVGKIKAEGNTQMGKSYAYFFDAIDVGYHYFRLKILDFDDKFAYSAIRVEKIENTSEIFSIMPNPVYKNSVCTVEWYPVDDREKVKLLLLNINGQLKNEFLLNGGINTLDFSGIQPGVYYVSIEDYYTVRKIKKIVILDF